MPEQRTDKSGFQSRFGGGWISASQWLAESMCDRIARRDGVVLGDRFWDQKDWKKFFQYQAICASRWLKDYSVEALVKALKTPSGKRLFSLKKTPWLGRLVTAEQKKIDARPKPEPQSAPVVISQNEKPREPFTRKPSALNKLRDLDG